MGADETAITIPGGPRVIDVFDGNGAPSGPNYLLFSDVDRLADSLSNRSGVGWSQLQVICPFVEDVGPARPSTRAEHLGVSEQCSRQSGRLSGPSRNRSA